MYTQMVWGKPGPFGGPGGLWPHDLVLNHISVELRVDNVKKDISPLTPSPLTLT